ncbi:MAG: acyl-CoA dehydrogenase family protein [Gammaproteobacteria bacterium]|nr:acyl-CoA dehydrogenase family protein [Gammaproteobacteria bacterium]NND38524.1 acyl-CoA dehydrogenase [Pseudomonadales bacterium]NNM10796.1 acyl-CoA dehydrogenase [Pseudomonadales bacterium]RZV48915.1 MAG: acyl-CoA dehydrogenase [Pseudomonadales bacterium]
MFVDYTEEQKRLRKEFRSYFADLIKPEYREELRNAESGELYKELIRQQGKDNMLAVGWPEEYGGRGLTESEQLIRFEESLLAGAPTPFVTLNTVGPAIMGSGTDEQKKRFLPGIASGEMHFSIGYTEPSAGTDLAALKTAAVKDGDHYVVNGNKIFTSGAEGADYVWLAARTDPSLPKHKGISILVVDTKDPGFSFGHINTIGSVRTNVSYYTDVKVPLDMIIGHENGGWRLIMEQLNHERVGLAAWGIQGWKLYRDALDWARKTKSPDGQRVIDDHTVQRNFAEVHCHLEAMRLLNARMSWQLDQQSIDAVLPSAVKVYSTEILIEICRMLMDIVGPHALIAGGSEGDVLHGNLEHEYRRAEINTFGGGVVEVLRGLVATHGLGMPQHR